MKIRESTREGNMIMFQHHDLEVAMQKYITMRHTIDESHRPKRKSGFYIYSENEESKDSPFLHFNFKRKTDAVFVINLLERRIPSLKGLHMFIRQHYSSKKETDSMYSKLPNTKWEVEELNRKAREEIWKRFKG